jgi:hypothetical protein
MTLLVERTRQPKQFLKERLFITAKSHAPSLRNAVETYKN